MNVSTIVTVPIIRLVLKTNVLTLANYRSLVEKVLFARQHLIDRFVDARLPGPETLMMSVTNVC